MQSDWTNNLALDIAKKCRKKCAEVGLEVVAFCLGADFINNYTDEDTLTGIITGKDNLKRFIG